MENQVYSPSTLNNQIKELVENYGSFKNIQIEGEITNWKPSSVGHIYFNIKDEFSMISCAIWKSSAALLRPDVFKSIKDGVKVVLKGSIDFYLPQGKYNFIANKIEIKGKGDLWERFEKLKLKLKEEGLFDEDIKKPISPINYSIGVITSETGAVIEDIKKTIQMRFPIAEIHLYPTVVQGDKAKDSIVKNILKADKNHHDVLIIGRGGGSLEDLWSFNEEDVAYAMFNAKTPIVSSVGHETDFTIADFVADFRASTPTQAAMKVVPDWKDLQEVINLRSKLFNEKIMQIINNNVIKFNELNERYITLQKDFLKIQTERITKYDKQIDSNIKLLLNNYKNNLSSIFKRLDDLNPENILQRGYSIVQVDGKTKTSVKDIELNSTINIKMKDGKITSIVKNKEQNHD